jgi:HD-GYP domain-containing protein (c-di-GMP phosphodiesterase class II)
MARDDNKQNTIKVDDLENGMTIVAYSGFNQDYQSIDAATCKFVRHNFRGTAVSVVRNKGKMELNVDDLKIGDTLNRIYNFPPHLKKITLVNASLVKELKKRGMIRFLVKKESTGTSRSNLDLQDIIKQVEVSTRAEIPKKKTTTVKQQKKRDSIGGAGEFIQKVKESVELRETVSLLIEESMDNARKGKIDVGEIDKYVDAITKDASAEALSAIMSLKEGDQLYDHSIDVGSIFQTTYLKIQEKKGSTSVFKSSKQAMMAALMHDFGKSKIPKDIIDSTKRFSRESKEMDLIKSHPLYGSVILQDLDMPRAAINMAQFHHVKQDTSMVSSYPIEADWKEVTYETRLLAIVDIYQALVGRRKYKRSWSAPATMRYLDALAGVEYDQEAWDDFIKVMGIYPQGSLVELNDGSQGFVVGVPQQLEEVERPQIAIVRNGHGEDLSHSDLLDLGRERDMSITQDLDYAEVFGNGALDRFVEIELH